MTQQELELPKGWVETKLDDICIKITDGEHLRPKFTETGVPFLSAKDISEKGIILDEVKYVLKKDADKFRLKCNPEQNDILIVSRGNVGRTCLVDIKEPFCLLGSVILVKPKKIIRSQFLNYYLNLFSVQNTLVKLSSSTVQGAIYLRDVKKLNIFFCPLNEQKRIVSKIEELFSRIDSTKQSLEYTRPQLEQYRHSLLKSAFDGKLTEKWRKNNPNPDLSIFSEYTPVRFDDQNKSSHYIFEKIPETWRVFELAQIADVIDPHPSHRAPPIEDEGFPFAGIGDIDENGTIDVPNTRKVGEKFVIKQENSYKINENSLGYGRVGTVGKVIRLRKQNFRYSLSPTLSVINNKEIIKSELLFYVLKSTKFFQQVSQNITGTTRAAIGIIKLRKILLSIPPMEEQEQIVSQIEQGFTLIENSQRIVNSTLQTLETMRMSVLKQAFEGKLVPQDPNDEPAEILLERIKKQKS